MGTFVILLYMVSCSFSQIEVRVMAGKGNHAREVYRGIFQDKD